MIGKYQENGILILLRIQIRNSFFNGFWRKKIATINFKSKTIIFSTKWGYLRITELLFGSCKLWQSHRRVQDHPFMEKKEEVGSGCLEWKYIGEKRKSRVMMTSHWLSWRVIVFLQEMQCVPLSLLGPVIDASSCWFFFLLLLGSVIDNLLCNWPGVGWLPLRVYPSYPLTPFLWDFPLLTVMWVITYFTYYVAFSLQLVE